MNINEELEHLLSRLEEKMIADLRLRCEAYEPDLKRPEVFNVVTALLARQVTLALELSSAPQLWNNHSAPLFLRAMADVHITLAWILLDPSLRARQYIDHGLGQAVLELEHRRTAMEAEDADKEALQKIIDNQRAWIDSQRWNFLVEVNVGAWSGKNTRQMAQEADLLNFYNYVYSPFSQCAHSTWYHVGRFNTEPSRSPYTDLLWEAGVPRSPSDIWNLDLAIKYLDKSFDIFDEKALGKSGTSDLREWLNNEVRSRFARAEDEGS